jgi:hypothetical protein
MGAEPVLVGLDGHVDVAGRAQALGQARRIDGHAHVADVQLAEVPAVERVAAGEQATWPQQPVDVGEKRVLRVGARHVVQHREADRAAEPSGGKVGRGGIGSDDGDVRARQAVR